MLALEDERQLRPVSATMMQSLTSPSRDAISCTLFGVGISCCKRQTNTSALVHLIVKICYKKSNPFVMFFYSAPICFFLTCLRLTVGHFYPLRGPL